ncbi:hypothetical protein [Leptolyngbya sp. FACHB-541]|uniref:hypothetical protein n=1 Tax=Leptolyngbya sp. FACHB-541 TaxID=2692810 RepID=UPI001688930B|nr:hypothetical protein [Leptolyngbya sp. FACHB-541]MBD1870383.1 hypothetical protein [Cyanobacteria bacterium FACHB-471]
MVQHAGGELRDYLNCQTAATEPIFTTAGEAIALVFLIRNGYATTPFAAVST